MNVRRRIKSLNSQFADRGLQSLNVGFEYVLVYAKSEAFTMKPLRMKKDNFSPKGRWDVFWSNADRPTMRYELLGFTPQTGQWRNSKEKADVAVANYQKYMNEFSDKMTLEEYSIQTGIEDFIRRIPDGVGKNGGVQHWVAPSETSLRTSNWTDIEVSQIGKEIDLPFENPKSKQLIMELIQLSNLGNNDIVLDFFSGSATTADAVMQLNGEDGGNREFIMVQLPELTDASSDAFKAGFKTLTEIGKERIRRAGAKIKAEWEASEAKRKEELFVEEDSPQTPPDTGFKVFKLDTSNLKTWDDTPVDPGDDEQLELLLDRMNDMVNTIKTDRSDTDMVYEIMLKMGVPLTYSVNPVEIDGKRAYSIGDDSLLLVCLQEGLTAEIIERMAKNYLPSKMILSEKCFADDTTMANAHYILKERDIELKLV